MVQVQEIVLKEAMETKYSDKPTDGVAARTDSCLKQLRHKIDYTSKSLRHLTNKNGDITNSLRDFRATNPSIKMSSIFDIVRQVKRGKAAVQEVPRLELNTSALVESEQPAKP